MRRFLVVAATVAITLTGLLGSGSGSAARAAVGIRSISPGAAARGDTVVVNGNGFGGANVRVTVGGVSAKVLSANGNSATFVVPAGAPFGPTKVRTTNPGGQFGEIAFTVLGMPPLSSITVTSSPDTGRRVTKSVGRLGGSLETMDADGTVYRLVIPPGALGGDTTISLTPTSVAGLDQLATSVRFGVEFAPSGLTFGVPATLVIGPPTGAPSSSQDLVAGWEGGAGIELHTLGHAADGSLLVSVPHFSGVAAIHVRTDFYNQAVATALAALPQVGAALAQLARDAAGLPLTQIQVVLDFDVLYTSTVSPAVDRAKDDLVHFRVAKELVDDLDSAVQALNIENLSISTVPGASTLGEVDALARHRLVAGGLDLLGHYQQPACDGAVIEVADWFAIPLSLLPELALLGENLGAPDFCAVETIQTVQFPGTVEQSQQTIDGKLRGGILAPAQTPGGEPTPGGQAFFPEVTHFQLGASGATFGNGSDELEQTSGPDGMLSFQLDRGPDETQRPLRVTVSGSADFLDFAELGTIVPVNLTARPPSAVTVAFRSPPVNDILQPGGTTQLCVDVSDAASTLLPHLPVDWFLEGSGSLSDTTTLTDTLGTACIDYHHPAGLVPEGDTATIRARASHNGATGSDETTLTPAWLSISLEAHPASASGFVPATNTTVNSPPGDQVQLRINVTANGQTAADPPVPCASCPVDVAITSGGGQLIDPPSAPTTTDLVGLDANGQALVTWDPGSFTGEAHVEFSVGGVGATVTLKNPVSVAINPNGIVLAPGQQTSFTATVTGAANQAVTWSATGGTVTSGGVYTAGSTAGSYSVTATSVADPSASATATVQIGSGSPLDGTYVGTYTYIPTGDSSYGEADTTFDLVHMAGVIAPVRRPIAQYVIVLVQNGSSYTFTGTCPECGYSTTIVGSVSGSHLEFELDGFYRFSGSWAHPPS